MTNRDVSTPERAATVEHWYRHRTAIENISRDSKLGAALRHSTSSRAEIHQATGVVLVQFGVSAADALARMRAYAFAEQRGLVDVARDVVSGRLHFSPDPR